jgi:histidinol-phosphatase (PHP family)
MVDFHTHTYLCGHATGEPEQYILKAIEKKIKVFGISDHAPLPDDMRKGVTMGRGDVESYIDMVLVMKEKHASQIDIKLGFEVDFPMFDSFDMKYYTDERIDYFIGSCHFIGDWPIDMDESAGEYETRGVNNIVTDYFHNLHEMVESSRYHIIGHIDLFKKFGHRPTKSFSGKIESIAKSAARLGVALELNTAGLRKPVKEVYPSMEILKIFSDCNAPVTLGSDAHSPNEVGGDFDSAIDMLRKTGFKKISAFSAKQRYEINL